MKFKSHADFCLHLITVGALDPGHQKCVWETECVAKKDKKDER